MKFVVASAVAMLMVIHAATAAPATQPAGADVEFSKPARENGADFEAMAQPKWVVPPLDGKTPIELGLKVTNRTEKPMQVNRFDTVQIRMDDSQGMPLVCVKTRDATFIPEPLVLKAGESQIIARTASLEWIENARGVRLTGRDGAGGTWHVDISQPGKYSLRFTCSNSEEQLKSVLARPSKHVIDPKEAPFWMGKVVTPEMTVEVVEVPLQTPAAKTGK